MPSLKFTASFLYAVWLCFLAIGPALAAGSVQSTPEDAITGYMDGIIKQDFKKIISTTSYDDLKGFDFIGYTDRLKSLSPLTPAPATDPFFIEINKAEFVSSIARQVRFLTYGLMTTSEIIHGTTIEADRASAESFANTVRAQRLSGLKLVKIGIPRPGVVVAPTYQRLSARRAILFGADSMTERVALLSFEGSDFLIGFTLLEYKGRWTIQTQSTLLVEMSNLGTPKPITPEEFEALLK